MKVKKHNVSLPSVAKTQRLKPPPNPHQTPTYAKPHRLDFKHYKAIINALKRSLSLFFHILKDYKIIIKAPVGV